MRIANLIEAGACQVNSAAGQAGYRIIQGDLVDVILDEGAPTSMTPEFIPLEVIHEDEDIIVVVKPAGLLVHPTMNVKSGTLLNALAYHLNRNVNDDPAIPAGDPDHRIASSAVMNREPRIAEDGSRHSLVRPGLVHRLDRATSGLMVIARNAHALAVLSRHFRKHLVSKRYVALVLGDVEADAGEITAPIGRDPDTRPRWRVMDTGKPAETRFTVIERLGRATLLELEPVTGRTNQLRIHCAHIGHPIVGDETREIGEAQTATSTSESSAIREEIQDENIEFTIKPELPEPRLCLHAWKLSFHHPASGERLEFTSSIPDSIATVIDKFRLEER